MNQTHLGSEKLWYDNYLSDLASLNATKPLDNLGFYIIFISFDAIDLWFASIQIPVAKYSRNEQCSLVNCNMVLSATSPASF